jgi:tetraacyldisaccharide 4'-kinase
MPQFAGRLQRSWAGRGWLPRLLLPVAGLFGALVRLRHWLYGAGLLHAEHLAVPVIVVGNLIVGGAGKTPTVLALVAMLRRHGRTPAVLSRGFGGSQADVLAVQPETPASLCGDEPLLLRRRAGVPVFVGRDRVAAGRALLQAHPEVDVIVSDDGLQHLHLGRRVQVLVFDERGAGNGWLLPAGPLREPLPGALPPASVVLYNAAKPTTPLPGWVAQRTLGGVVALQAWWQGGAASCEALAELKGRRIVAAAGLGRPERFFDMLRRAGLDIEPLPLPDHFDFTTLPWPADITEVIVTEKDAVKLDPMRVGGLQVWVVALDFQPAPAFDAEVLRLLGSPSLSETAPVHGHSPA